MQRVSFADVGRITLDMQLQAELERHLRDHINYTLEREVRSAAFLREVQRQEARAAMVGEPVPGK
jgi:membrane carboxypeptidase/penicillin-binding protein PbpC